MNHNENSHSSILINTKNDADKSPLNENNLGKKSAGIRDVLSLPEFKKLWIGQACSQLADKFYIVLMVYLIAQYWVRSTPENSVALEGIAAVIKMNFETRAEKITVLATGIYLANTIPAVLFGTFAGVIADKWSKKYLMVISNGLRAFLVLFVPTCLINGPILLGISWGYWALIGMTFIESTLTQFFAPAEQATIPLIVGREQLLAANSIYQATSMGATIVGFALGDPILRVLNQVSLSIGINGGEFILLPACYGLAAISIWRIKLPKENILLEDKKLFNEMFDGYRLIRQNSKVRGAILNLVILYSLLAALYVLTISLASTIPELGPTKFGTLLAISGIGMVSGAIVIAQIGHNASRRKLASSGLGVITLVLILLGPSKGSLNSTLILCGFLGIGSALVAIPAQTTLHEDTPASQRGKIFGLQNNLINISLSLPLLLASTLLTSMGLIPVLWLLAVISLLAAILERPWKNS